MTFKLPSVGQLKEAGDRIGIDLDDERAATIRNFLGPFVDAYNLVGALPEPLPPVKYPRTPGYRPTGADNRWGAWFVKTRIEGARRGPLAGKTVAIKDTIAIAGVPMMNGASVLEGYIPDIDATVVTRLLDAGATILGKTVCEYFSYAGGSATSAAGVVESPRNPGYTPGGSSTGSAAVVAAGEVDIALGGDQAGSIRIPASYSGVVGLKPTYGLVPYSGIMSIEATIDHTGPMTADVATNALALEALAGEDGLDPRQRNVKTARYTDALGASAKGLKIALVREGFGQFNSEPDVDAAVRAAARRLERLGARVVEVSIPWHAYAVPIWGPLTLEGSFRVFQTNGTGTNVEGLYSTSLAAALAGWRRRANEFPPTIAVALLLSQYAETHYHGRYYAKAQNLRRSLRAAYDAVLAEHDLLLMPTTRMKTSKIPPPDAPFEAIMKHSWENIANTCGANVTGHPAISIPCGLSDARPVGLMLMAKHWNETALYRAAHAFERAGDWRTMGPDRTAPRRKRRT